MSTIKLNKTIREAILEDIIGDKFASAHLALMPHRAELARKCYERIFLTSSRKKMEALPKGWLPTKNHVQVSIGSGSYDYHELKFSGWSDGTSSSKSKLPKPDNVGFVSTYSKGSLVIVLKAKDALACTIVKLHDQETALVNEEKRLRLETMAVLESVTTANRLIEIWPAYKSGVPAKLLSSLNKALDLPPEQRA